MDLTIEQINRTIQEARGLKLCSWRFIATNVYQCEDCGSTLAAFPEELPTAPDYTDPANYLEAMAWAKKQDWWYEFYRGWLTIDILLDPKQGSYALASYIRR